MLNDPIVIVGAARTPMAAFQGDFATLAASDLGAAAIKAAVERAGIAPGDVERVIFGCVLPAGQGQAPARQASLKAGLPLAAGCTTVNKMCGSAMEAAILAHDALVAGSCDVVVDRDLVQRSLLALGDQQVGASNQAWQSIPLRRTTRSADHPGKQRPIESLYLGLHGNDRRRVI